MDPQSSASVSASTPPMLPPQPGKFKTREEMIESVGDFATSQGYIVIIKQSKADRYVMLGCDRGGVYRPKRKTGESDSGEPSRKRKTTTKLTGCPFELMCRKYDGGWAMTVKNGTHNHEPYEDISEHPAVRRLTEEEVLQIKEMTEAGLKTRQILKRLKKSNPDLSYSPRTLYNLKSRMKQGKFTVKRFSSIRPHKIPTGVSEQPPVSEPSWKRRHTLRIPNFVGGKFVDSQSGATVNVLNPANQQLVCLLPFTTIGEFKSAALAAKRAFLSWKNTPVATRQRIILKFRELIQRESDKLAASITAEEGKTLKDAYKDVHRGLDILEHTCGVATSQMGKFVSNVANGLDVYSIREPIGVCAGVCLSNFPAIIALWMFPVAVICGNTFILKSSVKNPGISMIFAELAMEAGLPDGVLNIVHGTDDVVNTICEDDDIKAVSFAAARTINMHVYSRACSAKGKRVQSYSEGRSHIIVMPDADMDVVLNALVPAAFRADGERCFALNTVTFVGDSKPWEAELVKRAQALQVNAGTEPNVDIGPMLSKQEKEKLCKSIQSCIDRGARLILDGRNIVVSGYEEGNFVGPTILGDATVDMECYREDIFGPILLCMQTKSLEEAIRLVNASRRFNGASIFTTSGASARKFQSEVEIGQIGINVHVSVPMPFISSSDSEAAIAGQGGVHFYTKIKTVREQWDEFSSGDEGVPNPSSPMTELLSSD